MKTSGYQRYKYSGELYKFVSNITGDTETIEYYFAGVLPLIAGLDDNQRLILRTEQPIQIGSLLANIKDADNNPILDDMVWQITSAVPVMNAFNTVESYRSRAVKYQGQLSGN